MTDTAEMVAFVGKRLGEFEAVARAATPGPWIAIDSGVMAVDDETWPVDVTESAHDREDRAHIAAHSPQAVLRWIEAARERLRLLQVNEARWNEVRNDREPFNAFANGDACGMYTMARRMVALDAATFRDHPDYRSAWGAP